MVNFILTVIIAAAASLIAFNEKKRRNREFKELTCY